MLHAIKSIDWEAHWREVIEMMSVESKAYEQARYLRTARVQIMARVYGDFYHARGVTAELRDMAVGGRTAEQAYEGISWLYGGP